ncbi:MAG: alpha/beta hydrolase [Ignavibacteriae bacterium HGW-Ignavibacteriae-3]|nr:MAG: alpha/beta hydrolase [Ignavibacteriae bacterium HGW-Ignavibacteriae-3]
MKKLFLFILPFLFLGGCSGFLYTNLPPVEFQDIDYGFPTKTVLTNPSISYIDVGKGDKTIILVHGLASNAGFWRYAIPLLSQSYRVIAVDLPGYGKSQKGAYPYTMTFYADQLNRLADELKLGKFILAGHSMGGQIGIIFSLKYPEKLEKLVLASPAGVEEFEQGEGDWLRSVMTKSFIKKTPEDGIRRNLAANFYSWEDKWEWMVEERVRMVKAKDFDEFTYTVVRCVNGMLDEPTFDKLKNISVPTLIVHGKNDGLIPNPYLNPGFTTDVFEWGAKQIPNCKSFEIDECGHMLQIEKPEEFSKAVLDFIK